VRERARVISMDDDKFLKMILYVLIKMEFVPWISSISKNFLGVVENPFFKK